MTMQDVLFSLVIGLTCVQTGAIVAAEPDLSNGWQTESNPNGLVWQPKEDKRGTFQVSPALARGQSIALCAPAFSFAPWHRYRLSVEWRGGLFYHWSATVRYQLTDGSVFEQRLFPERNGAAPSPNWETRLFDFITPSDATQGHVVIKTSSESDAGYRPAVRDIRLQDLGAEPLNGEAPGLRPPRVVTAEELAERGGGRGYLLCKTAGRHILNQAGASVHGAGIVLTTIWARGDGTMYLSARLSTAGKGRFFDFKSPTWTLTKEWRAYSWELPIVFAGVEDIHAQILADIMATGPVELDEPNALAIQSTRPPPLVRPSMAVSLPTSSSYSSH